MIPKIIHYCWFGGSEIPDNYKAFISEWKELHPDWEIIRWDETNSPMNLPYLQNAEKNKKWANMSNLVRLYVLKKHGGIYLDTDMKILKSLNPLLSNKCFFGFEEGNENSEIFWVNNAIVGAIKNHKFINSCFKILLEEFDGSEVPNESSPRLITKLLKQYRGLKIYGYQELEDIVLYPTNTFYPINYEETYKIKSINTNNYPDSYAIHTWGRTWFTPEQMLDIIDKKQEYIVNLKLEIEKKSDIFNFINDQKKYYLEFNSQNNETKQTLLHLKNDLIEKIDITNNKLNSIDTIQDLIEKQAKFINEKSEEIANEKQTLINEEVKTLQFIIENQQETNTKLNLLENSFNLQIENNKKILEERVQFEKEINKREKENFENIIEYKNKINYNQDQLINELLSKIKDFENKNKNLCIEISNKSNIIKEIQKTNIELQKSTEWYKITYENRSFWGVIKTKLFQR